MSKTEEIVGRVIFSLLLAVYLIAMMVTFFRLVFRDGRGGVATYGTRGDVYLYESY